MKPKFGLIVNTASERAEEIIENYAEYHGLGDKPLLEAVDELGIKLVAGGEPVKDRKPIITGVIGKGEVVERILNGLEITVEGGLDPKKRYIADLENGFLTEV